MSDEQDRALRRSWPAIVSVLVVLAIVPAAMIVVSLWRGRGPWHTRLGVPLLGVLLTAVLYEKILADARIRFTPEGIHYRRLFFAARFIPWSSVDEVVRERTFLHLRVGQRWIRMSLMTLADPTAALARLAEWRAAARR